MTKNILTHLQEQGTFIDAPCNGNHTCGKCLIRFSDVSLAPRPSDSDITHLSDDDLQRGIRLACAHSSEFYGYEVMHVASENVSISGEWDMDIMCDKIFEETHESTYGIAIDMGSTTLVFALIDTNKKRILDVVYQMNPQSKWCKDVISRIAFSLEEDKHPLLVNLLHEAIYQQITLLLTRHHITYQPHFPIILSGNSVMTHLYHNTSIQSLGYFPFLLLFHTSKPLILRGTYHTLTLPLCSAFIGGDIVSGIYATKMHTSESINVLLDLGTNGEVCVGNREKLFVSSAAAGPAFEGMNMSCGMAATHGAIYDVDYVNGGWVVKTLFDHEPLGICGSGYISLIAKLVKMQWITPAGVLLQEVKLTDTIALSQKDIREFQLAKSAIRTTLGLLMEHAKVTCDQIHTLTVTGGFTNHLKVSDLMVLNMIPQALASKITLKANTSLTGAMHALFHSPSVFESIAKRCISMDLSIDPLFESTFVDNLHF